MTGRLVALQSADFRRYFSGQFISAVGTQMQQVALAWQLYLLTHSPVALGLIGAFKALPVLVFALGGGVVADSVDRRRLMLLTQSVMAISSLVLLIATVSGFVSAPLIYAVTALSAVAFAFDRPAAGALVPRLVPREHLSNALSLNVMGWQAAGVAGPAIGGLLLAAKGPAAVYAADVATFLTYIALLASIRRDDLAPEKTTPVTLAAALEGLRFIRGNPLILSTMVLDFLAMFFGGALLLMPFFADQVFGVGERGLGLLYAAQPAGAALAAGYLAAGPKIKRHGVVFLWMLGIYGTSIALFGMATSLPLALLAMAISGAADTVSTVIRGTLRQLLTPDEMRGRMTSVGMIFFIGGPQLGEVEAGVLAKFLGAPMAVTAGGIVCLFLPLIAALAFPQIRRYTEEEAMAQAELLAARPA
jgi:MFS family permease